MIAELIGPWRQEQETTRSAVVHAVGGGMEDVGETVGLKQDDGKAGEEGRVQNLLLRGRDAGGDEHGARGGG